MITNGVTVPDPSTSRQYIPDPIGGWMYIVDTTVSVSQQNLQVLKDQLAQAQNQIITSQSIVNELAPQVDAFEKALTPAPVAIDPSPSIDPTPALDPAATTTNPM